MTAEDFVAEVSRFSNPQIAAHSKRFFKTGKGDYGENDEFIGIRMPNIRKTCKLFKDMSLGEIQKLLDSKIHEHRLGAAIILSYKYPKASDADKQKIFDIYLKNVAANKINNWDIVDVTCEHVVGAYLSGKDKQILYKLAQGGNLWERRVAIISTFFYIKRAEPGTTLDLAEILFLDKHDLIQKAVGWMLREVGKRCNEELLIDFLDKHAAKMPRTTLRYAIEKLTEEKRQYYLKLRYSSPAKPKRL